MSGMIRGGHGRCRLVQLIGMAILLGITAGSPAQPPAAKEPETIERALARHAPEILRDIRKHGYKNVGVLRFRANKDGGQVTDRIGLINQSLADRLEIALILADDLRAPIGIIHDASAVAAGLPGANHLEADGRRVLLGGTYPLAWGRSLVSADAFLTGMIEVPKDLKTMTVTVLAFDAAENVLRQVTQFTASTDAPALFELGESLMVRGGLDDFKKPSRVFKAQGQKAPVDSSAPVALQVFFDGVAMPLEYRGDQVTLPEPKAGQKLEFGLSARGNGRERYGCVLKINGENTLFREREPSPLCSKWVVGPGTSLVRIRGYQAQNRAEAEEFHVLSSKDSGPEAVHYGKDTGLITLEVFPEVNAGPGGRVAREEPPPIGPAAEIIAAISRAHFPTTPPANRFALLTQLRSSPDGNRSRGVIVAGEKIAAKVREEEVEFESTSVMSATIRYYRP